MNKKDKANHNELCDTVRGKFAMYQHALRGNKKTIPTEVLDYLDIWEIELRQLMHDKGLLMPKRDDPNFAISGGHY